MQNAAQKMLRIGLAVGVVIFLFIAGIFTPRRDG